MGHSLLVNTKETDYFHTEGEDIEDVDCCIKTHASSYVHTFPPEKKTLRLHSVGSCNASKSFA